MPDGETLDKFKDVVDLLKETAMDDLKYKIKCEDMDEEEEDMCQTRKPKK